MESEMITLRCPACGKEIQVPADLEAFSCLYCGAKHKTAELLPPTLPADEADRAYVEAHLLDCVKNFPNQYKQFTRKKFESSYQAHLEAVTPCFEALDRYVCAQPQRRQQLLEDFAEVFLRQWESWHQSLAKGKAKRERLMFDNKLTLAWYTMPALRHLGLSVSEDFARVLNEKFVERYPGNYFGLATYEELRSGFRRRSFFRWRKDD